MPRYLFIVSRCEPALFAFLQERFAGDENVQVILDRRTHPPTPPEHPSVERRTRADISDEIRTRSYAIVTLP
jgi:hypothetical protein